MWIVYHVIPTLSLSQKGGKMKFFQNKSFNDLQGKNLKALVFGDESDGSKTIYDFRVGRIGRAANVRPSEVAL